MAFETFTGHEVTSALSLAPIKPHEVTAEFDLWNMTTTVEVPLVDQPTSGIIFPFPFGIPTYIGQ